ncbi:NAD-dependent epimerase/dehydratase family protein [Nocardia halotolerans]|uniref:NAD-dependent epimerase/dehydratase family protein n=1 Tax=Nocardia halotolerans TaxID=1755878 RepID=A0ABV8VQ73_9NOCA
MKVVVTGASGNIGTALLRALRDEDWDVTAIARRPPPLEPPYHRARWVRCDIGGSGAADVLTEACTGADAVVHLAWAIHPRATEPPMWLTNRLGAVNVLRAAAAADVRHLVCASSAAAYAVAPRRYRVPESWPCAGVPGSAYSAGKVTLEALLDDFAQGHPAIDLARIRPCSVVQGDAGSELGDWVVSPYMPRTLLGRPWLPIPAWPALRLQVVHSDDVAAALHLILRGGHVGPFNLAGEPVLSAQRLVGAAGGIRIPLPRSMLVPPAWATWRLGLQPLHPGWLRLADRTSLVDSTRARTELDWRPRHSANSTFGELVEGMRADRHTGSPALAPSSTPPGLGWPSHQSQKP